MRAALLVCMTSHVLASDSLSYSGRLVNTNGSPVTGPVNLKFDFAYTNATTSILCTEQISAVALTNGVFHVKLAPDCTPSTWTNVLSAVPASEALAIRVTDETHTKTYSFQALHAMPFATMSQVAKQLPQMGATPGQILSWNGTQWTPVSETGTGNGTVTNIATGTGLSGGPITNTGTISIANGGVDTTQLADGAVTDQKVASGIARNKLANGTASHVLVNDGSGVISSVAQIPITQGGTGAANAAGARTNLGLGTAAVVDLGTGVGKAMPSDGVPVCFAFEKLQMTAGPAFAWACVPDNDSADNTKLPLDGSVAMIGNLDMDNHLILDVATPTADGHAANKLYVDSVAAAINGSQWTTNAPNIHFSTGNVGIGIAVPTSPLDVRGAAGIRFGVGGAADTSWGKGSIKKVSASEDYIAFGVTSGTEADTVNNVEEALVIRRKGNVGIGTSAPTNKLEVVGDAAFSGKVRMKSTNANYVELQAPAALASTLTFRLPGVAGSAGNALVTDGAGNLSWSTVATASTSVGGDLSGTISAAEIVAGAITNTEVAAGAAIAQSKIANLTTDLAAKEPTIAAGSTTQYWRGDKSWQTLNTTAVAEGTNLYFTEPRVLGTDLAGFVSGAGTITAADTVLSAIQKLDGSLNSAITSANTDFVNVTGDTMTGPLVLAADPTVALGAATKQYVDSQITSTSHWTKTVNDLSYSAGAVSINTASTEAKLNVAGAGGTGAGPAVMNISASDAGLYTWLTRGLAPNITGGQSALHVFGQAASTNNSGYIGFVSNSAGSGTNFLTLGIYGNDKLVNLLPSGNLGVGITAPAEKLDIATAGFIQVSSEASNGNNKHLSGIKFKEITGSDHGARIAYDGQGDVLRINTVEAGVENSGVSVMRSSGYVGIGAVTPTAPLHVNGTTNIDGTLRLKSDTANYVQLRAPASLAGTLTLTWPGTAGASGNALTTDGAGNLSWTAVATTATTVGGDLTGTIANAQIAAGAIVDADVSATAAIAQSKIANLTTDLAAKQPLITAGTTAQYWRGDKTWQTLNTTAVPEGTNLYFLDSRVRASLMSGYAVGTAVPLAATDTLLEALGKLEAQIIANDAAFDNSGVWSKNGNKIYYNTDFVGMGTNNPLGPIHVYSNSPEAMILERSNNNNSHIQYKNTIGNVYAGLAPTGNFAIGPNNNLTSSPFLTLVSSSQNLGLGTETPGAKLTVAGDNKRIMLQSATQNIADSNSIDFSETAGAATHFRIRYDGNIVNSSDGRLVFAAPTEAIDNILVLERSGKIGIGTNSPAAALHINSTGSPRALRISSTASNNYAEIQMSADGREWRQGVGGSAEVTHGVANKYYIYDQGTNQMRMVMDTSGQMGLGTVSPSALLHVGKQEAAPGTNGTAERIAIQPYGHTGGPYRIAARDAGADAFLDFKYGTANLMTFEDSGYVGFGTTSPGAKVDIKAGAEGQGGPVEALRISGPNSPANANSAQDIRFKFASAGSSVIRAYRGGSWDSYLEFMTNPNIGSDVPVVRMHISHDGNVGIGNQAPGEKLEVTGNVKATNFLYTSDSRLKRDVASIKDPIEKLNQLRGVNFKWKDNDEKAVGFIAQEVEKVFPELVKTDSKTGFKSVQYANIVAVLVEGFKKHFDKTEKEKAELEKKNKELERKISSLEKENELMNDRLDRIEKRLNEKK